MRSAVNQVGRDGGRVISNSVYGGRNYVPISNVSQPGYKTQSEQQHGSRILNKPLSGGKIVLLTILSLFAFPIGPIGVFVYGVIKYFDKTEKLEWIESKPQYVQDRRYKTNRRYIGDAVIRHKQTVLASPDILALNKKNGLTAMIIGTVCALLVGLLIITA